MRVGLFTREFPPHVYGGAGVHVDYLSRELAREIEVEVHCWGRQNSDDGNLHVRGAEPWEEITNGTKGVFKATLEALSLNLTQVRALTGIDIVHTHTWYVAMAGYFAKKLYSVPFVLTTHSLEPLRAYPDVQADRIHVIYNGIDLAEYQKTAETKALTDYGVDPSIPYVLFVGRVTRQKGVTHL